PVILFPLSDSLVNFSRFSIIGQNPAEGAVAIFLDGVEAGTATALKDLSFEFLVPDKFAFSDGLHNVYASYKFGETYLESDGVNFVVDTSAPEVFVDTFDMRPLAGKTGYKVSVKVSEDSIRTIVTIGKDSAILQKQDDGSWTGEDYLYNATSGSLPVEIFAQDLAGNEVHKRVGMLEFGRAGNVNGIFGTGENRIGFSVLGGLLRIPDFESAVQNFYLLFAVFLCAALVLMIGLKRHVQHPKTITAASGVIMLAVILFAI
ncbi:MAG: hypothetical protein AAB871_01370, partial [Patescibacteria group bacterium]